MTGARPSANVSAGGLALRLHSAGFCIVYMESLRCACPVNMGHPTIIEDFLS